MPIELRLPNLTGKTVEEQLRQIKGYLYSTIKQLNWALKTVEDNETATKKVVTELESKAKSPDAAQDSFAAIKGLIIKDSDIVEAYAEEMAKTYDSKYVAVSVFGTYQEQINSQIIESSKGLEVRVNEVAEIATENQNKRIETEGYVKTGIINHDDSGNAIIGVEIKSGPANGNKVFSRYTAQGTSLYNEYGKETVAIREGKTNLSGNVTIKGGDASLSMGGFVLDPSDGLGLYWEG